VRRGVFLHGWFWWPFSIPAYGRPGARTHPFTHRLFRHQRAMAARTL
jgi:hypothetical protein